MQIATQGGAVLLTVLVLAWVFTRHVMPIVREAMAAHQADIGRIIDAGKASQTEVVSAFRETLDRSERSTKALIDTLTDKIGSEVHGIRQDLDKVSDTLDGIRRDLTPVDPRRAAGGAKE